jgi:uncharacterized protein YbjQ (UPF0145 family)
VRHTKVLLSTTSSLEGWEIEDYLGPVSAKLVIGTGLLTDIFSQWTDFFGAASRSYQNKLDQIEDHALEQLQQRAARKGATAVIGLRVDHDEISGGGKSMLMVTAMGTAVRARRTAAPRGAGVESGAAEMLPASSLDVMLRRKTALWKAERGQLDIGHASVWSFLTENRVGELLPHVLQWLEVALRPHTPGAPMTQEQTLSTDRAKEYLHVLAEEEVAGPLHEAVHLSDRVFKVALDVISERGILDLARVAGLLGEREPRVAARALQLLTADPALYAPDDVGRLQAVQEAISSMPRVPVTAKKKMFGGTADVWTCDGCSSEVDAETEACPDCGTDIYTCRANELGRGRAAAVVSAKIAALQDHFASA